MLSFIFWIFSLLFFTSVGFLLFQRLYKNQTEIYRRVSPFLTGNSEEIPIRLEDDLRNKSLYVRLIQPSMVNIRQFAEGKLPKQKMIQVEKRLHMAGWPFGLSATDFVLVQIFFPATIFLLFLVFFMPAAEEKLKVIVLASIVAVFVYTYLNYYLSAKRKQRIKEIEKAMPDFFDMLNVSIEAGMGLDGALKKLCNQMDTPLSKEFLSSLEDMKLGKSRKQAFIDLRDRVPSDFFKSVMNSIIQADQMGIGMSKVLRTQSQRIREKQRFSVKEQAMKAPVKMLIPMVFFIFPTLFVVLLGPVVVNLVIQFL